MKQVTVVAVRPTNVLGICMIKIALVVELRARHTAYLRRCTSGKQRSKSPTSCGALGDVENARDLRSRGDVDHTHVGY